MKVLVIGGTLFIGLETVKNLLSKGHDVTLFHRGKHNEGIPDNVRRIIGDKKELEKYRDEFKELTPDVVLDMVPFSEKTSQKIADVMKGISRRIVAISSCDVYQAYGILIGKEPEDTPIDNSPLTEESPVRSLLHPYEGLYEGMAEYDKILAENVYLDDPAFEATILRLPIVYGINDYQHRLFPYIKRMKDNRPAIILNEDNANWVIGRAYVENVSEAVAMAIISDKAKGQIYNVAEPYNFTENEWVEQIGRHMGWDGRIVTVPEDVMPAGSNFKQNMAIDSSKIREQLGFQEVVGLDEALDRSIEWESSNMPQNINPEMFDYESEDAILENL
jgi:nucleoside-diphosphate-sugar epimerase